MKRLSPSNLRQVSTNLHSLSFSLDYRDRLLSHPRMNDAVEHARESLTFAYSHPCCQVYIARIPQARLWGARDPYRPRSHTPRILIGVRRHLRAAFPHTHGTTAPQSYT